MSAELSRPHKPSIFIFAVCGLMILSLWGFVLTTIILGLITFSAPITEGFTPPMYFSLSGVIFFVSLLLIPSCYLAFRRMINHPVPDSHFNSSISLMIGSVGIWMIILGLAKLIENNQTAITLVMPILHILGFGIPIYFILSLVLRNSPPTNPQRPWFVFNYATIGGTFLSLIAEALIGLIAILGVTFLFMSNYGFFENFLPQFGSTSDLNPEKIQKIAELLFSKPQAILVLMLMLSGATPIIEETLKPLGLFAMRKNPLTPADGFKYGAVSGAGFGLLESLFSSIQVTGSEWVQLAVIRIGSDSMHILASGLVGWGIVSLFWYKGWKRFIVNFLIAAGLHGLWNSLAILIGVNQAFPEIPLPGLAWAFPIAPYILLLISIVSLISLWFLNRRFFMPLRAESV